MGYQRAGFTVTGVDIEPQPEYPGEFFQADALEFADKYAGRYHAIHASPPCQRHSAMTRGSNSARDLKYPDLIREIRMILHRTMRPYVIENVIGAPLRRDLRLCGEMFGLSVIRHRIFELGRWEFHNPPAHIPHRGLVAGFRHGVWAKGPYVSVYGAGGGKGSITEWRNAMGIDWTFTRESLAEAIPPAYTELIGRELMNVLPTRRASPRAKAG